MTEAGFSIKTGKNAKAQVGLVACSRTHALTSSTQVLECIKHLQSNSTLPIQRARMRVRITMPAKDGKRLKEQITQGADKIEDEDWGEEWEVVSLMLSMICTTLTLANRLC